MNQKSYKSTVFACYIANFSQAIVINFTPIIFISLKEQFGLSYAQFGSLILANFIAQVTADLIFSKAVDKHGFRPFIVAAHAVCVVGFLMFILTPVLLPNNVYFGFLISTIVFSASGGLFELLLSPIIDAIPTKEKDKAMAVLHSFYAWGQVTVVIITTLGIFLGLNWSVILLFWTCIPLLNMFFFTKVPLAQKVDELNSIPIKKLLQSPIFIFALLSIIFGGAAEVTMAQWASSFFEKGIALPKIMGDMIGMCGFAVMLGLGRLIYGLKGDKLDLNKILIYGSACAAVCYIIIAISPFTWLSIIACAITGFCVSLLWPGTIVVASKNLPLAGASMFAMLAAGGDIGASIAPWLTGVVADFASTLPISLSMSSEQFGLRFGILVAAIFPIGSMIFTKLMASYKNSNE